MKSNKEIKKIAKKAVSISRGKLIGLSLSAILLGGVNLLLFLFAQAVVLFFSMGLHSGAFGRGAVIAKYLYILFAIYLIVSIFAGSFVELGYNRAMLLRLREKPIPQGILFYFKSIWFNALTLRLFMAIRVLLWSVLLIIPGILAMMNYSMAPFLMAQHPKMDPASAIRVSKHLMKGYKPKLAKLILSFADEIIISILALGFPFVYVIPRIKMAVAEFYRERAGLHDEEVRKLQGEPVKEKGEEA